MRIVCKWHSRDNEPSCVCCSSTVFFAPRQLGEPHAAINCAARHWELAQHWSLFPRAGAELRLHAIWGALLRVVWLFVFFFVTAFGSAFFHVCLLLKSLFLRSECSFFFFPMQKHFWFFIFFLEREKKKDDSGKEPLYPPLIFSPFVQHFWSRSLPSLPLLFGSWVTNECFTPDRKSIPGTCLDMVRAFETMHDKEKRASHK